MFKSINPTLTVPQLKALPIGARVALIGGVNAYPDFNLVDPRLTGTIATHEEDCVWVTLDHHHAELDEWSNQVQVWYWLDDVGLDMPGYNLELLLDISDATLDAFVRDYCAANAIVCDGDVFGLMFSEDRDWTASEAAAVIEDAADLYALRITATEA